MKLWKKCSICLVLFMVFVLGENQVLCHASELGTAQTQWEINQSLSADSCKQGDSVVLSVYLTAGSGELTASQMSCTLEYDTELFSVSDVTAEGMTLEVSDYESGNFVFSSTEGKSFSNGALLVSMQLAAKADSATGKTSLCVTDVNFQQTDGNTVAIQSFSPASLTIEASVENSSQADGAAEDETEDIAVGEEEWEDTEDIDVGEEEWEDTEKIDVDEDWEAEEASVSEKTAVKNTSGTYKTLDKNYKTGAGFGNDIYFVIAGIAGSLGIVMLLVRRRLTDKLD